MKLRHCAALALLAGWYLIAPPSHGHHVVDGAPLSRYLVMGSYDSAADCNIGLSQLLLVNKQFPPPHFLLAADQSDDENTVHGPADVGLPPYKPIPAAEQADLDNCAKVTTSPNFDADIEARLQRLNLDVAGYGPSLVNDKAAIVVEVTQKITPEIQRQFDIEMQGLGQGYPILLKQHEKMHLLLERGH